MAYNWRAAVWVPSQRAIYAVNGRSGYLFRFDPTAPSIEVLKRLTSARSKRSGMYDENQYGYLGLALGRDGHTLFYLTGDPLSQEEESHKLSPEEREGTDLIAYDTTTGKYSDKGAIRLQDGAPIEPPQSLVIGSDGTLYTLAYVIHNGVRGIDLVSFQP